MRAGKYAEFEGVTWLADFSSHGGPVYLNVYSENSPAPEFLPGHLAGHWERRVERKDCSRLFYVATSAYWAGVYPAEVRRARGNGLVEIQCSPLSDYPGPLDAIRGLDWAAPRLRLWEERGVGYYGVVPETELTHVTSETHEIGTEPTSNWKQPRLPTLPPATEPTPPQDQRTRRKRLQ